MTEWVVPQLMQWSTRRPGDDEWLHEIKFDRLPYALPAHSAKSAASIFGAYASRLSGARYTVRTHFIWRLQLCDR